MPVKHWSSAGLMVTTWCNARCASCYLACTPERTERMNPDDALRWWAQLIEASPHGCRVHLTGGEPFGDWPGLIDLAERAHREGLGPLEAVETNAFWATDAGLVRRRLEALDAAGMGRLVISADPFHQQFVPIRRARLVARVGGEVLGRRRVRVRWWDWLRGGYDTGELSDSERQRCFGRYLRLGRERLNGRAADRLPGLIKRNRATQYADKRCGESLLRGKGVHVGPGGWVVPGTCAGIVLGSARRERIGARWRRRGEDHADRPIVGTLVRAGPMGLVRLAESHGLSRPSACAGACGLCWLARTFLWRRGLYREELAPDWLYASAEANRESVGGVPTQAGSARSGALP